MKKAPAKESPAPRAGKHPRLVVLEDNKRELMMNRLNRLSGQLEGIKKMVEEGRYCIDILNQVSSAHEGLRSFGKVVLRNYLESCATTALRSAEPGEADRIYDEIVEQFYKNAR